MNKKVPEMLFEGRDIVVEMKQSLDKHLNLSTDERERERERERWVGTGVLYVSNALSNKSQIEHRHMQIKGGREGKRTNNTGECSQNISSDSQC